MLNMASGRRATIESVSMPWMLRSTGADTSATSMHVDETSSGEPRGDVATRGEAPTAAREAGEPRDDKATRTEARTAAREAGEPRDDVATGGEARSAAREAGE